MKTSVTTLFYNSVYLLRIFNAGKQYAINLTAGDTELKGSQRIPLVELCFKFLLPSIVACNHTGIQRYVGVCLICLIPFNFDVWLTVHRNSMWIRKTN